MSEIRERILKILKESNIGDIDNNDTEDNGYFIDYINGIEGEVVPLRDKKGRYTKGTNVVVTSNDYLEEPQKGTIVGYENDDIDPDMWWYVVKLSNGKIKLVLEDKIRLINDYTESSMNESPIDYVGTVSEDNNGNIDTLTIDIPLFLRLLEYAKEDAKTDLDLHYVTENALKCMKGKDKLSMDCYENIIPSKEQEIKQKEDEVDEDEQI